MQTSITSFFAKKKHPSEAENEQGLLNEADDANQENVANTQATIDLDEEASSEPVMFLKQSIKKRPVSECDDSDDEVVHKPKTAKRLFLDSPDSSPVKDITPQEVKKENQHSEEEVDDKSEPEVIITEGGDEKEEKDAKQDKTPAKKLNAFPSMQQSPLMNPDSLIKKKISSGAFALHENIGHTWFRALQGEFDKAYFKKLSEFVKAQRQSKTVYPPPEQVYTWTHYHAIKDTRVVIIGQDPYHGPNQAHGLSFSVQKGNQIPKSLQNIYKELQSDIDGFKSPGHGDLTGWAKQGVLMLNACLTVNKGEANSHQGKGWESFTDAVISWISKNVQHNVVFLLWGRFAQKKSGLINKRHKILTSAHPSPLSADNGFFGCKHFSQSNAYLRSQKLPEIKWTDL